MAVNIAGSSPQINIDDLRVTFLYHSTTNEKYHRIERWIDIIITLRA